MGHLERLLRAAPPRCAWPWSAEAGEIIAWHACVLAPGHAAGHACACGAAAAEAA